jgi:threonylcarbamoyladenosine tRNA methylthiotransferase CDKAL1
METRRKYFYIETYGCSASQSDAEIITGLLSGSGLERAERPEHADLLIINTCYVKQSTENKILGRISELAKKFPEKKMIISGCMPDAITKKLKDIAPNACLVSTNRITEIEEATGVFFEGEIIDLLGYSSKEKVGLSGIRKKEVPAIIQICSGCLGNCSYCGTKLSKGNLVSYSPEKIANEIELARKSGCREFWLTGQDIGCYGFDKGTSLPQLLEKILKVK